MLQMKENKNKSVDSYDYCIHIESFNQADILCKAPMSKANDFLKRGSFTKTVGVGSQTLFRACILLVMPTFVRQEAFESGIAKEWLL